MAAMPGWQQDLLTALHAPATPSNLKFLDAWQRAEGGTAAYNPLNTTQSAPGATAYNPVGVRNFVNPQQGLQATVQTLTNGRYGPIVDGLRSGADPVALARDVAASPWGTGSGVLRALGANPAAGPVSAPAAASAPQTPATDPNHMAMMSGWQNALNGLRQSIGLPGNVMAPRLPPAVGGSWGTAPPQNPGQKAATVVEATKQFIGTPYVWGGESPKGFDCSGLLQYVWHQQGVAIPRTTYEQFKSGAPVPSNQLQPGDAVFFTGSDPKNGLPGHVGMYIGGGKFVEAPHTGASVRVSTLAGRSDYVGARRYG